MSIPVLAQQRRRSLAGRLFFVAGAALALSAVVPWGTVSGTGYMSALTYSARPSSGTVVVLLMLAAGYGWAGWTLREQSGSRRLMPAMWIVNALVASMVLASGSHMHDQQGIHVVAGGGFLAAFCAACLGSAATVALHRSRSKVTSGSAPATPREDNVMLMSGSNRNETTGRNLSWPLFLVAAVGPIVIIKGLGVILGHDLHFRNGAIPNTDVMLQRLTIPVACSMVFAAGLATWLGWWPPIWHDHKPVQRWVRVVPFILIGASILGCDYGNLLDQTTGLVLLLVLTAAMVGFTEELMFRGIGVNVFRRAGFTEGKVALWTSLSFGAIHLGNALNTGGTAIFQALIASFIGYLLYLIRRGSGGIALAMITHGIWDFALLSNVIGPSHETYLGPIISVFALIGVAILVLARRHRIEPGAPTSDPVAPVAPAPAPAT